MKTSWKAISCLARIGVLLAGMNTAAAMGHRLREHDSSWMLMAIATLACAVFYLTMLTKEETR